jgi:uncharacterized membrane protein
MICLYKLTEKSEEFLPYFLIGIYIVALSILLMSTSRYNAITGTTDILDEFSVSKVAFDQGRWPEELMEVQHVTGAFNTIIFPVILSQISGLSIEVIFRFVNESLGALIPIFLFIVVKEIFKNIKLASLSAFLYMAGYWFYSLLPNLSKMQFAVLFLLLTFYSIFNSKSIKFRFLAIFFLSQVFLSHYTSGTLTALILVTSLIVSIVINHVPKFLRIKLNYDEFISKNTVLLCFGILLSWLIYGIYPVFQLEVSVIDAMILSLKDMSHLEPQINITYLFGSKGLLLTSWFDLQYVLIAVGVIYSFFVFVKGSKGDKTKESLWTLWGCILAGMNAMLAIPSGPFMTLSMKLYPDRWMLFGYIFFSFFLAVLLLRLEVFEMRIFRKRLSLKYIALIFILLSPTMNMLLPFSEDLPMYHPEGILSADRLAKQAIIHTWDHMFAQWISENVPADSIISTDLFGRKIVGMANHKSILLGSPDSIKGVECLIIPRYYRTNGIWVTFGVHHEAVATTFHDLLITNKTGYNVLYDDGQSEWVQLTSYR